MAEYIEREKARELIKNYGKGAVGDGMTTLDPVDDIVMLARGVDLIPTADVQEVRHGEWVRQKGRPEAVCSDCGREVVYKIVDNKWWFEDFCPHCGAKMDGKGDAE